MSTWLSYCGSDELIFACSSARALPGRIQDLLDKWPVFVLREERLKGSVG